MHCNTCDIDLPSNCIKCPSCKRLVLNNSTTVTPSANFQDNSFLLCDIKDEECIRLDVKYLNRIFGGPILNQKEVEKGEPEKNGPGLTKQSVIMLGGQPGAGKSTLMLQMADLVVDATTELEKYLAKKKVEFKKNSGTILYIAAEEAGKQIKPRAQRLKLKHMDKIRIVPAMGGGIDIGASIMMHKPALVIIDSLAGLVGDDNAASIEICKLTKEYSDTLDIPFILTQHLTKGEEIAGLNTLQHAVDTILYFHPDDENGDIRILEVNPKNRFGRAYIENYFIMGESGLTPVRNGIELEDLYDDEDEE